MAKKWVKNVNTGWNPPEGLFTQSADKIANALSSASKDLKQAMSRLNFYINRAGDNLSSGDKSRLNKVKDLLQKKMGGNESHVVEIPVLQEFQIPGTDIVLEEGDSVKILERMIRFDQNTEMGIEDWLNAQSDDPLVSGQMLGSAIVAFVEDSNAEFQQGFYGVIKRVM